MKLEMNLYLLPTLLSSDHCIREEETWTFVWGSGSGNVVWI